LIKEKKQQLLEEHSSDEESGDADLVKALQNANDLSSKFDNIKK
jgi:hypothetical protein